MEKKTLVKIIVCAVTCLVGAFVGVILADKIKAEKLRRKIKKNQLRMKLSDGRTLVVNKNEIDGKESISVMAERDDGLWTQSILGIDSAHDFAPLTGERIEKEGVELYVYENPDDVMFTKMIGIPRRNKEGDTEHAEK